MEGLTKMPATLLQRSSNPCRRRQWYVTRESAELTARALIQCAGIDAEIFGCHVCGYFHLQRFEVPKVSSMVRGGTGAAIVNGGAHR